MYYFIREQDLFNSGLPMGYEIGLIDGSNPAPEGSITLESDDELKSAIEKAEATDAAIISGDTVKPTQPQTLRWPAQYIPLTWSVNWDNAPSNLSRGQMLTAMRRVFNEYTRSGLRFRYATGSATLEIGFRDVDGPGGTLAFVYQPASGTNMAACGGQCGNYFFDNTETLTIIDFENIFRHETGHAIGMDHTNSGVMAPTYAFGSPRTILDELVTDYIEINYPVTQA